mmetsp:Transcript_17504/g.53581  ORF Transcript_17504/g.53581 Transcript_17504/m.53581 type:complete len:246 (+) Transcript_17504:1442-2179(+)
MASNSPEGITRARSAAMMASISFLGASCGPAPAAVPSAGCGSATAPAALSADAVAPSASAPSDAAGEPSSPASPGAAPSGRGGAATTLSAASFCSPSDAFFCSWASVTPARLGFRGVSATGVGLRPSELCCGGTGAAPSLPADAPGEASAASCKLPSADASPKADACAAGFAAPDAAGSPAPDSRKSAPVDAAGPAASDNARSLAPAAAGSALPGIPGPSLPTPVALLCRKASSPAASASGAPAA